VREPRHVDLVEQDLDALAALAEHVGQRAVVGDLAARQRFAAQLVLEALDAIGVARTVVEVARHHEGGEAGGSRRVAVDPRQQDRDVAAGVGAEPLLAVQAPVATVGHGAKFVGADVRAARLLRHELRALHQFGGIEGDHAPAVLLAQLLGAVAQHQHGRELGDGERAHQAELGLREEIMQRELDHRRDAGRPAEDRPVRCGVQAELVEAHLLHLVVGGMMLDPLHVAAKAVAVVQHRRMLVGLIGPAIEIAAGQPAEPIEVRPEMHLLVGAEIKAEKIAQAGVCLEEIEFAAVAADMVGPAPCGRSARLRLRGQVRVHAFLQGCFAEHSPLDGRAGKRLNRPVF
jgi:hypothetical protein